jgi:hypothetical protein
VFALFATISSIFIVRAYPRRLLLIPGSFIVGTSHLLVILFDYQDNDLGVLIIMVLLVMVFFVLLQPVSYLYMYEVGMDATLGICKLMLFSSQLLLTLITPFMLEKLTPKGTFLIFAVFAFCGRFYNIALIRETAGLSDKEKKLIY